MGFIGKFGKGVKQIVGGMILGIFLLPLGVFCQYKAANQMQYGKYFDKATEVSSPSEVSERANIKTRGVASYSGGSVPYEGDALLISEGDIFDGQYIVYAIKRYHIKETKTEKTDDDGNKTGQYEYSYNWEEFGTSRTSPSGIKVNVNGFSVDYGSVRQNYIPGMNKHFQYSEGAADTDNLGGGSRGGVVKIDQGTYNKNSGKPSATEDLYTQYGNSGATSNFYVAELVGDEYKEGAQMTLCGSAGGNEVGVIDGPAGGKMLALSYSDMQGTKSQLESSAKAEGVMKFVLGSLCFMIGFSLLFGPIIKLLDFIPILGDIAIGIIYFILAIVSAILSVLFWFLFKFWWLILGLAIVIPIVLIIVNKMKKKAA